MPRNIMNMDDCYIDGGNHNEERSCGSFSVSSFSDNDDDGGGADEILQEDEMATLCQSLAAISASPEAAPL